MRDANHATAVTPEPSTNFCQQISCQNYEVVLFSFSYRHPGGDRRADRGSFEPEEFRSLGSRLTAKRSRPEMAPQRLEKIESAPGIGMVSEASNPQDLVRGRAADRARLRLTSRQNEKVAKVVKLQKKAPNALKSLDAELKSAPVFRLPNVPSVDPACWGARRDMSVLFTRRHLQSSATNTSRRISRQTASHPPRSFPRTRRSRTRPKNKVTTEKQIR